MACCVWSREVVYLHQGQREGRVQTQPDGLALRVEAIHVEEEDDALVRMILRVIDAGTRAERSGAHDAATLATAQNLAVLGAAISALCS